VSPVVAQAGLLRIEKLPLTTPRKFVLVHHASRRQVSALIAIFGVPCWQYEHVGFQLPRWLSFMWEGCQRYE
jgi:hypothetical protein